MIAFTNFLFVPANHPDRVEKALSGDADLVCMDLEDSVPAAEKDAARATALEALARFASPRLALRINGLATRAGLADLLALAEPTSAATHVRFEAIYAPQLMSGQGVSWYTWPYVEGLRLDEAMNDLTLLATGLYGKDLPPQDGAPIRLVTPWKYGFKSIKAIVKIELVDYQPTSLWMNAAPNEYGFYANVNPEVDHPRWSQSSERRIGELGRRKTLPFNGYADEVADLYANLDLRANY